MAQKFGKHIFRAEHVGSFVRPERLIEAARSHRAGTLATEAFRGIQDQCIAEIVAFQGEVGMPSVTDGEYRRAVWSGGGGQVVDMDDTRRKLELVVELANEIWGST